MIGILLFHVKQSKAGASPNVPAFEIKKIDHGQDRLRETIPP
jgi:hypothetical protein